MSENTVVKGRSNPVIMEFTFTGDFAANGLNTFSDISMSVGSETYTTAVNVDELYVNSNTELRLDIGLVTALDSGCYTPTITGTDGAKVYELTGTCKPILGSVVVC